MLIRHNNPKNKSRDEKIQKNEKQDFKASEKVSQFLSRGVTTLIRYYNIDKVELKLELKKKICNPIYSTIINDLIESCDWPCLSMSRITNAESIARILTQFHESLMDRDVDKNVSSNKLNKLFRKFCLAQKYLLENYIPEEHYDNLRQLLHMAQFLAEPAFFKNGSLVCAVAHKENGEVIVGQSDVEAYDGLQFYKNAASKKINFLNDLMKRNKNHKNLKNIAANFLGKKDHGKNHYGFVSDDKHSHRDVVNSSAAKIAKEGFFGQHSIEKFQIHLRQNHKIHKYNGRIHAELHVTLHFMEEHILNELINHNKPISKINLLPDNFSLLIGTSMFCCFNCHSFIKKYNIIAQNNSQIIVQGTHHILYRRTASEDEFFSELSNRLKCHMKESLKDRRVDYSCYEEAINTFIYGIKETFKKVSIEEHEYQIEVDRNKEMDRPRFSLRSPSPS